MQIDDLVVNVNVAEQGVRWRPIRWRDYWSDHGLPYAGVIDELAAEYDAAGGHLPRAAVQRLAHDEPIRLLIAAMAWGFGEDSRGLWRVNEMLTRRRVGPPAAQVAAEVVRATTTDGAAAGFSALFQGASHGSRTSGLPSARSSCTSPAMRASPDLVRSSSTSGYGPAQQD